MKMSEAYERGSWGDPASRRNIGYFEIVLDLTGGENNDKRWEKAEGKQRARNSEWATGTKKEKNEVSFLFFENIIPNEYERR